jgi:hypothetical protein
MIAMNLYINLFCFHLGLLLSMLKHHKNWPWRVNLHDLFLLMFFDLDIIDYFAGQNAKPLIKPSFFTYTKTYTYILNIIRDDGNPTLYENLFYPY